MKTTVDIPDILLEDNEALVPELKVLVTLVRAWLLRPESRRRIKRASVEVARLVQEEVFHADHRCPPESAEDRRNGFARWLSQQLTTEEALIDRVALEALKAIQPELTLGGQAQRVAEELIMAKLRWEARRMCTMQ